MIHRENIQEWLLLYADNELSAVEREAVESFLRSNPDLRHELETLLELRFTPDEVQTKKLLQALYIPIGNLSDEEISQLIDYADEEADANTKSFIKQKIEEDSGWDDYYKSLIQTKHRPALEIVFPDKTRLYQKTPIFKFSSGKILRAAAIIILMITTGVWIALQFKREKTIVRENKPQIELPKDKNQPNNNEIATSKETNKNIRPDNKVTNLENKKERYASNIASIGIPTNRNEILVNNPAETKEELQTKENNTFVNEELSGSSAESIEAVNNTIHLSSLQTLVNNNAIEDKQEPVYFISTSESTEYPNGAERIIRQAKRTLIRRLKHTIGEEPIRIGIIQINHK
jgi:hypothetical protein